MRDALPSLDHFVQVIYSLHHRYLLVLAHLSQLL